MRRKSETPKTTPEQVVKDIRRATRKHHSAEDKIRIVLEGLRGNTALRSCAGARGLPRACFTAGPRSSWRLASGAWPGTRHGQQPVTKLRILGARCET